MKIIMKKAACVLALLVIFLPGIPSGAQAGADMVGSGPPSLSRAKSSRSVSPEECPVDCPVKKELGEARLEIERLNVLLAEKDAQLKSKEAELLEKDAQIKAVPAAPAETESLKQVPLPAETAKSGIPPWLPWLVALLAVIMAFVIGRGRGGSGAKQAGSGR